MVFLTRLGGVLFGAIGLIFLGAAGLTLWSMLPVEGPERGMRGMTEFYFTVTIIGMAGFASLVLSIILFLLPGWVRRQARGLETLETFD